MRIFRYKENRDRATATFTNTGTGTKLIVILLSIFDNKSKHIKLPFVAQATSSHNGWPRKQQRSVFQK